MSKISSVYTALVSAIDGILTTENEYTRIPEPEDMESNSSRFLDKAWGVYYNGATPSETDTCRFSNDHTFNCVMSRRLVTRESDTSQRDIFTKQLLEDAYLLYKNIYNYEQLGIPEDVAKIDINSTSEIKKVFDDKNKTIYLEIEFIVTIWENF